MNISGASSLNALIQMGLQSQGQPAKPVAATPTPPPATAGSDADGDNDGSRVGTQLSVKA
jgi:hypothetical protein